MTKQLITVELLNKLNTFTLAHPDCKFLLRTDDERGYFINLYTVARHEYNFAPKIYSSEYGEDPEQLFDMLYKRFKEAKEIFG